MNKILKLIVITGLIWSAVISTVLTQAYGNTSTELYNEYLWMKAFRLQTERIYAPDTNTLNAIINSNMGTYHIPGVAACIVKDSHIVWSGSYGYATIAGGIEVADTTVFLLASISKTVVANAAMQLRENESLDIDADINDYLPFDVINPHCPDSIITMRMLLCHTSSITKKAGFLFSFTVFGGDSPTPLGEFLEDYFTPAGIYYDSSNFLTHYPGTYYQYSNAGFALAGYIVECITGMSFEQYCRDSLFDPLAMNETSWFLSNLNVDNIATPYVYTGGVYDPYQHYGFPIYPAAQLRSSSIQLARHLMAFMLHGELNGVRILDSATVDMMMTNQFPEVDVDPGTIQGIGWKCIYGDDSTFWGHIGGLYGCNTWMFFNPQDNTGYIQLTNSRGDFGIGQANIAAALAGFAKDLDLDGVVAGFDNCPDDPNPDQADYDADGYGNLCDNCPHEYNPGQTDTDQDGSGDSCDLCPGYDDNIDSDQDGNPDGCDSLCCNLSRPGDANDDTNVNILDIAYLIDYLYLDGPEPACYYQGDADGNRNINILDISRLIVYLYQGGPEPNCP